MCSHLRHLHLDLFFFFFFFNDPATTEIYTLSLHDALPIFPSCDALDQVPDHESLPTQSSFPEASTGLSSIRQDRKSTRLNSSHANISYAVFCLKKKKNEQQFHQ